MMTCEPILFNELLRLESRARREEYGCSGCKYWDGECSIDQVAGIQGLKARYCLKWGEESTNGRYDGQTV